MARPADALRVLQALSEDAPRDHDYYNALGNALFQTARSARGRRRLLPGADAEGRLGHRALPPGPVLHGHGDGSRGRAVLPHRDLAGRRLHARARAEPGGADQPPGLRLAAGRRRHARAARRRRPRRPRDRAPAAAVRADLDRVDAAAAAPPGRAPRRRPDQPHRAAARAGPAPAGPHPRGLPVVRLLPPRHRGADDRAAGAPRHDAASRPSSIRTAATTTPTSRAACAPPASTSSTSAASATAPSPTASAPTASTS